MQASVDAAPGLSSCSSWALEHRLNRTVVAHGLSCSEACGIFPDQGLNPCFLHWQADSLLLSHQGSSYVSFRIQFLLVNSKSTKAAVLSHVSIVHSYWLLCSIPPCDYHNFCTHYSINGHLGCLSLGIL